MRFLGRTRPPTTNILEHMAPNVGFELIHLPSFPSSGHLCVWFEQVQLISHLSMGFRLNVLPLHRDPTGRSCGRDHSPFNWFAEIATSPSQFASLSAGEG